MTKLVVHFLMVCILIPCACKGQVLKNHIVADPNGTYHIFWEADEENITFQLEVKSKGYVGFGFSPNGGMPGSDVIIGWVLPNGTAVFHDRHAVAFAEPLIDSQQNYQLLEAYENETHTILKFTRKLNTCDKENDTIITDDTMKIIYSWHPDDPSGIKGLPYHGPDRRGSHSELLLSPQPPPIDITDDIYVWDIQMPNLTVPPQQTTYWCIMFRLPNLDGPHDYLGYTVKIKPGNEAIVHHFVIRECIGNTSHYEEEMATYPRGYECVEEDTLASPMECQPPVNVWAVGSEGQRLPDGIGITFGEKYGGASHIHVQMHYNNPEKKSGIVDDSKISYYLTNKTQPIQATMLQMFNYHDYTLVIPPHQKDFAVTVYCPAECTAGAFPPEGIHLFAVGFHTHLAGTKLVLRHFRGNQELKTIARDDHYDFNYQNMRQLKEPVVILPGDMLLGTCWYSSENKNQTITGGYSTSQEMCYFYLSYYPASPLTICFGSPDYQKIYNFFGVEQVGPDKVHITSPVSLYNQSFFDIVRQYDWASAGPAKLTQMASMQYEGTKIVQCQHQTKKELDKTINISYPMDAIFYVTTDDVCDANISVTSTHQPDVNLETVLETKPTLKSYKKETQGYNPTKAHKAYY